MDAAKIRLKLIRSCLCESGSGQSRDDRHIDLLGVCGFYILTNNEYVLRFYPLHATLASWLYDETMGPISDNTNNSGMPVIVNKNNERKRVGPLYAMSTTADGNCLLHAISICLWGVEDSNSGPRSQSEVSIIRSALKDFMIANREFLFIHYKAAEKRFDAVMLGGIETPESEYVKQFDNEIAFLDDNRCYLSALHVYCMANMLRRPIIVYANPNPNGIMRGIYTPTMFPPQKTYPFPLTLIWMGNHFTAVLSSECAYSDM
jgi:hypothetical protein